MNIAPMLYVAFTELQKASNGMLSGTKIEPIAETINRFAIYSAIAGGASCVVPGAGGALAALTQTGLVWTLYVQINKTLGIEIKDNVMRFIGSAVLTNIATNAGAYLISYVAASLLSLIPFLGTAGSVAIGTCTGYIVIYASAMIYLKLLAALMGPDGTIKVDESERTKSIIGSVVKKTDLKKVFAEGRSMFDDAKKKGELDAAQKAPECPICGEKIQIGQKFCSNCGNPLK